MNNKIVDKRELVIKQAEEMLLNMLKDHKDNEFCNYIYHEIIRGEGIEEYATIYIKHATNYIKDVMLTPTGRFKIKNYKNGKRVYYSIEDLLDPLAHFLSMSIGERVLIDKGEEIMEKHGLATFLGLLGGIDYYLKEILFGIKDKYLDECYNDFEKIIEEYILRA